MRFALSCLGVFALTLAVLWHVGPREPVGLSPALPFDTPPTDIETWLAEQEAAVAGIREGVAKEIVWADPATRARTPLAIVYLHGYSATSAETRPFADNLAAALGANLHFTRLTGHGRDGDAMATARVQDWIDDTAEALAVGRAIGDRVVVIGTSTGGTLATLAAADPAFGRIDATVLISPNYRVKAAGSALLTAPFARQLVPLLVGDTREWAPRNPEHGRFWTTRYPNVALLPMAATVQATSEVDFGAITVPAFFVFSDADQVVDAKVTRSVVARWGGEARVHAVDVPPPNDEYAHVIAGDILSPTLTAPLVAATRAWLADALDL